MAIRITGPIAPLLRHGLLDTGADDTVFPAWIAAAIGLDLTYTEKRDVGMVGRRAIRCHYLPAELQISDGVRKTYPWTATVGFVASTLLARPLLGYAGFLQYFDAEFRGADREVILTPNHSFSGIHL
jgi:hypothetical protein